jgi:hypothetical protein
MHIRKNQYKELRKKHQAEFNEFPVMFAFNDEQFIAGMKKLGLETDEMDKLYSMGAGGYYKKTDAPALKEMQLRWAKEIEEAVAGDLTGTGYIYDAILYELGNHEYSYTGDEWPALEELDITKEMLETDERFSTALHLARQ